MVKEVHYQAIFNKWKAFRSDLEAEGSDNIEDVETAFIEGLPPTDIYISPKAEWICPYCKKRNDSYIDENDISCMNCGLRVTLQWDF